MHALRFVAIAALLGTASAQLKQGIVPKRYERSGTHMTRSPFSLQPGRWQQVIRAKEIQERVKKPMRIKRLEFRSKSASQAGMQIEIQVIMSRFKGGLDVFFNNNLAKDAVVVFPRNKITLPTSGALSWDLQIPFASDFTWDGDSDVVIDVRVFGNGNQNKPFLYFFDSVSFDPFVGIEDIWAATPNALKATRVGRGTGLIARLSWQEGAVIKYGNGCKGQGGFVPEISANGIPVVGNTGLRVNVSKARPQAPAFLLWGGSDKKWGAFTLPLDLKPLGMPQCMLFAEPLQIFGTQTLGGNPGTGVGSVPFGIPPSAVVKGIELFAQWFVVDQATGRHPADVDIGRDSARDWLRLRLGPRLKREPCPARA